MNRFVLTVFAFLYAINAQSQSIPWAYSVGGSGWDDIKASHLSADYGYYIAGMHSNTLIAGPNTLVSAGYQDGLLVRMDTLGNKQWGVGIRGTDQEWVYDVCTDASNNVFVCGYFQSPVVYFTPTDSLVKNALSSRNIFIAKYSSSGVFQWARLGDGGNTNCFATAYSLTIDNQNDVIMSGSYNKTLYFGATAFPPTNATNIFLIKFNNNGNVVWTKTGVTNSIAWFNDMKTDAQNNIYVTGKISTPITFGATTIPNFIGDDMVTGKFDAQGNLLWMQVKGKPISATTTATNLESGNALALDAQGNVFVGGCLLDTTYYNAATNTLVIRQFAALLKYNNSGSLQWVKQFGPIEKDNIYSVAIDAQGDVYATGMYADMFNVGGINLPVNNYPQAFLAKFNSANGATIWAEQLGSSFSETAGIGVQLNPQTGAIYVAGNYSSSITFNMQTLTSAGIGDIFVLQRANSVQPNAINNFSNNAMPRIYPVPARDVLYYAYAEPLQYAQAVSMQGQRITLPFQHNTISLNGITPGNYVLTLQFASGQFQRSIQINQ